MDRHAFPRTNRSFRGLFSTPPHLPVQFRAKGLPVPSASPVHTARSRPSHAVAVSYHEAVNYLP